MAVTGAGLEGIIAAESEICFIDGDAGILSYQGYDIHTLAENATFEEVIYLLWHGTLPKQTELDALKAALVANRSVTAPPRCCTSEALAMSTAPSLPASKTSRRSRWTVVAVVGRCP